ncbi:MAG: hypothetical protein PHW13_13565 [Methylococcales bacterium]|nr:hypothetical protein [Methylococcales bacterium]
MPKTEQSPVTGSQANRRIALLSVLGIGVYLTLRYAFYAGYEVYTLSLSPALSSATAEIYHGQFSLSIQLLELPLIAVLTFGGIPQLYWLCIKLFQGDFGADLLAGLSIVTATLLI